MAAPVWVLSVDLQAKTATFQSGMGDAARAARGSLNDIKQGSGEMGREVGGNMMEARHGVMLLGEEFGVHLPRALTGFIASIGPIGAAMEAAFPFLAIAVGATLLIEHLVKMHEAGEKLTEDQVKFGTAVQNTFNALDEKLLQAEIRADELKKDHLGALAHQLELIDMQSMNELVKAFSEVAKAADVVFADLKSHWYTFGIGATGAKHALDTFQTEYDSLLAQGKDKEASDLLKGTRDSAQHILAQLKNINSYRQVNTDGMGMKGDDTYNKALQAGNDLKAAGLSGTKEEVAAQQAIVDALNAQVTLEAKIGQLKTMDKGNATTSAHLAGDKDAARLAKEEAEALKRGKEEMVHLIAEQYRQMVAEVDQGERETIESTKQGSAARLVAIDAAIQHKEDLGLQETSFYRELSNERISLARELIEAEKKLSAEGKREEADNAAKMGELGIATAKEHQQLMDSARRMSIQQRLSEELQVAQDEYGIKFHALTDEAALLDKSALDYANKLKAIQDKEKQLIKQHENDITAIKDKAEMERNARLLSAENQAMGSIANGLTKSIMGHQTWAAMVTQFGNQAAEGLIHNSLMVLMQQDKERLGDARKAATSAYATGESIGGPAGIVLGPVFAAAAFAGVMAFEKGTDRVPGYGSGDTVPSMLTPGEGVVPGGVMDGLAHMARAGTMGGGSHTTLHMHVNMNASALDSDGVDEVFTKHADKIQRHFENTLRKMNR